MCRPDTGKSDINPAGRRHIYHPSVEMGVPKTEAGNKSLSC